MLKQILRTAIIAGSAASLILSAGVFLKLEPLIRAGETFEAAEAAEHAHHDAAAGGHAHAAAEDEGPTGARRVAFTLLANLIAGVGFALVLTAAIAWRGRLNGPQQGVLWGCAGFAVFALAPALGLPPELPGMTAADLGARQIWWAATAALTAGGLALLVFRRGWLLKALGAALLLAPHLYGAPHIDAHDAVPPDLAAAFVAGSLAMNAVFWIVLGGLIGVLLPAAALARDDAVTV